MTGKGAWLHLLAVTLVALLGIGVLIGQPATAWAAPEQPCQALLDQAASLKARGDAHNATPHVFEIPQQQAAADAYDAEKRELDGERDALLPKLQACVEAAQALENASPGGPPLKPKAPDNIRDSLQQARDNTPPNWQPPNRPGNGRWDVPKDSPARAAYDALRPNNPGTAAKLGDVTLQGNPRPGIGDPDPAFPGQIIGRSKTGGPAVSGDHIIPLAEIVQMPGFMKLSPNNMYMVATAPANLQWLSWSANLKKAGGSASAILDADAGWIATQVQLETETRQLLGDIITKLLASQG